VQEAFRSEELRRGIQDELTKKVLEGLRHEISSYQGKIQADLQKNLFPAWKETARKLVREGLDEALRQNLPARTVDERFLPTPQDLPGEAGATDQDEPGAGPAPEGLLVQGGQHTELSQAAAADEGRWFQLASWGHRLKKMREPRFSIPISIVIFLLLGAVVWFFVLSSGQREELPYQEGLPTEDRGRPEPSPPPVQAGDDLRQSWIDVMARKPVPRELTTALGKFSFAEQYDCWFGPATQRKLEDWLAAEGELQIREGWRSIFNALDCVKKSDRSLVIYDAQLIAHELLSRKKEGAWVWCKNERPNGLGEFLSTFRADGKSGKDTSYLLSTTLDCAKLKNVRIGSESPLADYLLALYSSLQVLREIDHRHE
jgi:hypothetical protein